MIKKYSVSWTNAFLVRSKGEVQRQIQAPYTKKLLTPLTELSPPSDFIRGRQVGKEGCPEQWGWRVQREGPEEMTYNLLGLKILGKPAVNADE